MFLVLDGPRALRALARCAAAGWVSALVACGGGGGGSGGETSPGVTVIAPGPLAVLPLALPAELFPGGPSAVALGATGGDGRNTWSVDCSAALGCSIQGAELRLESRAEGGRAQGTVTVTVTDGKGARASVSGDISVWPKTVGRWLNTVAGAADRPGLHLVVLADGFTEQEMGEFRHAATMFVNALFRHPEVAAHQGAWNVHLAELPASARLAGGLSASRIEAVKGCFGLARLVCVNAGRAQQLAGMFVPQYTQVLVIVNEAAYGGSGGTVAVITQHPDSIPAAVHELGHSFAGLADEYIDAGAAEQYTFNEGTMPNVTAFTELANIPWKHWIDAGTPLPTLTTPPKGEDPVGLYEGAMYVPKGRYRATFASFMRELEGPFGPVNGEAWAREVYVRGGAWAAVAPAESLTLARSAQPAGGWLFKAEPLLPATTVGTRWYVNGVELVGQRGASQLLVPADGAVKVRAELVDLTGRVRLKQGVVSTLNWSVP